MDAQLKISRAVTNLAFSQPFFGSCLMQLKLQERVDIPTMATDSVNLFWNSDFVTNRLTEAETRGVLAHEVMHVILKHCVPHPGKDLKLVNVATDWVINYELDKSGFELPEFALRDPTGVTNGWAWQEVYNYIRNIQQDKENPFEGTPNASSKNPPNSEARDAVKKQIEGAESHFDTNAKESSSQQEERASRIDDMITRAAEAAQSAGRGQIPGSAKERLKALKENKIDWREQLQARVKAPYKEDYTFSSPNRKFLEQGLYLPSMVGSKVKSIGIGLDTSGSMTTEALELSCSEVNYIINELKPEKVYLLSADYSIANVREYDGSTWFTIEDFNIVGGGGTSFRPVFDYIEKKDLLVDQVIYFSDMYVNSSCFPEKAPPYPVIFVSTNGYNYEVPFGDIILMRN